MDIETAIGVKIASSSSQDILYDGDQMCQPEMTISKRFENFVSYLYPFQPTAC